MLDWSDVETDLLLDWSDVQTDLMLDWSDVETDLMLDWMVRYLVILQLRGWYVHWQLQK